MGVLCLDPACEHLLRDVTRWRLVSSLLAPDVSALRPSSPLVSAIGASGDHRRPYRQVHFALEGESEYVHGHSVYPWRPGTVFLIDAQQPHGFRKDAHRCLDYLVIELQGEFTNVQLVSLRYEVAVGMTGNGLTFRTADLPAVLDDIWTDIAGRQGLQPEQARQQLMGALAATIGALLSRPFGKRTSELSTDEMVDRICEHIREVRGRHVTLANMARVTGYSIYHVAHLFRKRTGMPLHRYVTACRAQWAEHLLARGYSRACIAFMLGFSERRALSKWLKKRRSDDDALLRSRPQDGEPDEPPPLPAGALRSRGSS